MNKKNNKIIFVAIAVFVAVGIVYVALTKGTGSSNQNQTSSLGQVISGDNAVGKPAPDFSLPDINGNTVQLSDLKGKNVVLFFTEGEMCYPACWNQVEALGTDPRFNSADTIALSIVVDTPGQWQRIESQMPQFKSAKILFDTTRGVSSQYGVLSLTSSMHPGSFPGHTYFIVDKNGMIRFFMDDPNMAVRNDQLMDEINKLN